MKILFDIYHMPQFNFFKRAIEELEKTHALQLCSIRRGRQVEVIRNDCPGLPLTVFGNYSKNKGTLSFVFKVILPRLYSLCRWIKKEKFQLVVTANYQANIVARLLRIPSVGFNDDPEKINLRILKAAANEVYVPIFATPSGKVKVFNALKEWAYLSPAYFTPQLSVLEPYGLKPNKYIFMREVSTRSLNYRKQKEGNVLSTAGKISMIDPVVLSLEDKGMKDRYPPDWILLQEPVEDIHSLMYFSRMVISSGDSMAREAAMLGVPGIYCGIRDMAANRVLIEKNMLFKITPENVPSFIKKIENGHIKLTHQDDFRQQLFEQWDDVTQLTVSIVERHEKKHSKRSNT